jgi:hypothetical protein
MKTYRLEEEGTNGWQIVNKTYQHLTKERCTELYNYLLVSGVNPNYLRVVRDDQ